MLGSEPELVGELVALVAGGATGRQPVPLAAPDWLRALAVRMLAVLLAVLASVLPQFIGPWHLRGIQWDQGAQVVLAGRASDPAPWAAAATRAPARNILESFILCFFTVEL